MVNIGELVTDLWIKKNAERMKSLSMFFFEWKHFTRSPFKVVAVALFLLAGVHGLHNGASLYHKQIAELQHIEAKAEEDRQEYLTYYDAGKVGPEDRPWVDMTEPFWAMWHTNYHHFKKPSPAVVYSLGQAEQYGFYKRVTFRASPYDSDMTMEIANPERLHTGTLDFSFALLYLSPLLLLVLLYNLKTVEAEQGFLPLIEVQTTSKTTWILRRAAFYVGVLAVAIILLLFYGSKLTPVFSVASKAFGQLLFYSSIYLLFWSFLFFFVIKGSKSVLSSTLKMVGLWLLFVFIIPAGVHQWVSMEKPANLMIDFINATRDKQQAIYALPDSVRQAQLETLLPEIVSSSAAQDSIKSAYARDNSNIVLVNDLLRESIAPIEADNLARNSLVETSYVCNPLTFFQNRLNRITETHYDDYRRYREEIQALIDQQVQQMTLDYWNEVAVDKEKFKAYFASMSKN